MSLEPNVPLHTAARITMLALVVWREARGESPEGQLAVAYSIMRRTEVGGWWGTNIFDVVRKQWQYSSMTDPHDRQLTLWPREDAVWFRCLDAATKACFGATPNPAPGADSYFDDSIPPPAWAKPQFLVCKVGRLSFYNCNEANKQRTPSV